MALALTKLILASSSVNADTAGAYLDAVTVTAAASTTTLVPVGMYLLIPTANVSVQVYNGSAWVVVVGAAAIAAGAVTSDKLASGAVTASIVSSGAITAPKLSAGTATNAYVLTADSTQTSGMKWAIIPPSGGLSTSTEGAIMTMAIGA